MHRKATLSLLAAIGLLPLWAGPKVTVIGDSYSTWGPLQPSGYAVAYNGVYNSVTSVEQQYWKIFINHVGGELCVLNAWSGSFLAARSVHQSFVDQRRLNNLGDADIVVICGGTNDAWGSDGKDRVAIGEEKYGDWTDDDLKTFFPALTYLVCEVKKRLPEADIVIVANSCDDYVDSGNAHKDVGIAPAYCAAMKTVAEHYGLCFVQCSGVEKNDNHPTVAGFATMGAQLNAAWDDYAARKQAGTRAFKFVSRDPASATGSVADFDAAKVEETFTSGGIVYRFLDTTAPIGFTLKRDAQLDWALLVGGGGAGGGNCGGGGGGGGLLDLDWRSEPKTLAAGTTLTVSVGAGGVGNNSATAPGENGHDSSLTGVDDGFTAFGGGGGGSYNSKPGSAGGCGGGGVCLANNGAGGGGASTMDGAYGHGQAGGGGVWNGGMPFCGGGGGAGGEGETGANPKAGDGGEGYSCEITGTPVLYAGGGGAGAVKQNGRTAGLGGSGGGGDGAFPNTDSGYGENGTDGLGGGGGGAGGAVSTAGGGSGGSGVVILRFAGSFTPVLEAAGTVSATNSPFAMTIDCTLLAAGEGATEAEVFIAYGEETVGERVRLGTLSEGASGHYEITGLTPDTDYLCHLILVNNAETPSTVVLGSTIRTLPVAEELKPVVTLTRTDLQVTSAKLSVAVPQIGEGSDDATVSVRLTAGDAVGEWEVLAASVTSGWTKDVTLSDLQTGVPHVYEVKVLNALGISRSAQVAFTPVEPEPDRDLGRTVSVAGQTLDDKGQIVKVLLAIGNAGQVFSNTKLYAAYAEADAGERREDWGHCDFVADIPNDVRSYEYTMPEGWGTDYLALRFFTVSDALPPASTAYLRGSLHAQWDAIDNAGVGQHVASSNIWTNLADTNHDLTWQGETATFGEKGVDTGTSYFAATTEASWWTAMGNAYTWEAYVTIPSSVGGSKTLMGSNLASLSALFCQDNGANGWGFYQMYSYAGHGDIAPQVDAIPHDGKTPVYLAYVVTPEGAKLYVDGVLAGEKRETMHAFNETTAYASANQFWVGAGYATARTMPATVHAVRLYASSLTEEQVKTNFKVDQDRFGDQDPTAVGVSPLLEKDAPRLEVRVTPFSPTTAWFDYTLVGTGFGATNVDVFLSVGVETLGTRKRIGTLKRGQSGRRLVDGLSPDVTCVWRMETENDATPSETWSQDGEFVLHFDPVESTGNLRTITLEPSAQSVKINLGAADYDGTFPLYACYGATVSTDGKRGWDHVVKVADVAASTSSLVWQYPSSWGWSSAAVRFVLDGSVGYDVHEYIDSTGTQYVFTGLKPKMSMSYAGKAQSLNQNVRTGDKWATLYGCYVNGDQCLFWYGNDFYYNNPGNYKVAGIGTSVCEFSTTAYDTSKTPRTSVTANGTTAGGNNNWSASLMAESMPLFAFDRRGVLTTCNSDIRLYAFKAYDGGTLVRDFVPIVKDGVPMLFDRAKGDPEHGPFYPRNDNGEAEFAISESVTGEKVFIEDSCASAVLYYDGSMKPKHGFVLLVR